MSCSVGCSCASDPTLLRLWCRRAATAPIPPLAWELPYATGVALKRKKKGKRERKGGRKEGRQSPQDESQHYLPTRKVGGTTNSNG